MNGFVDGGRIVVAFYGDGGIKYMSEVVGYMIEPTYVLRSPEGRLEHWAKSLVREATTEETIDYWKQRALRAEKETDDGR